MPYSVITDYQTTLGAPMTSTQLTCVVNSIKTNDYTPHTITTAEIGEGWYLTIAPGTSHQEIIKVTAVNAGSGDSGTFTIDSLGRGLAFYGSTDAQVTGNAYPHNPGDVVILSNTKNYENRLVNLETDQTIGGEKTFSSSPKVPLVPSDPEDAPSKNYVDVAVSSASGVTDLLVSKNGSDPTLTINVNAGEVEISDTLITYAGASAQAVTASSTNYVMLRFDGTLVINTTGFIDGDIPLAIVVTSLTTITSVTDKRPFFTIGPDNQLIDTTFTYGATISVGDPLRVDATSSNKLIKALGTTAANADGFIGIALDAGVNTDTNKRVLIGGRATGFSGLTPDAPVYLSDTGTFSPTAGTYKKRVGIAQTSSTFIIDPGKSPDQASGTNSSVTATTTNESGAFFSATKTQGIKETFTAGQDLAIGEVVALESDGKIYRSRPTDFSTSNAGTATNFASTSLGTLGKMYWFDTSSTNTKCFLGIETGAAPDVFEALRATVDVAYESISSSAVATQASTTLIGVYDAVQHNSGTQVSICFNDNSVVKACSFDTITGTPSFGSNITLEASGDGGAICDTASAGILVAFSGIAATELRSHKITFSGTTLTESTNATLLSGGTNTPLAAGRFTGTDFIAVAYYRTSDSALSIIIGQYAPSTGTWSSVGSAIQLESSGMSGSEPVFIYPISSTKVAVCYVKSTDLKVCVVTRSSTTASAGSILTVISGAGTTNCATFKQIGTYSYFAGCETSAGSKLQIIALDRDLAGFSLVGSAITNGAGSNLGMAGCLLYPNRWLALYQDAATTTKVNTRELTTNLASVVGITDAAITSNTTGNVTVSGYSSAVSNLTAGSAYYTNIDGQLTSSAVGTGVLSTLAPATRQPKRKILSAISTTTGIIT